MAQKKSKVNSKFKRTEKVNSNGDKYYQYMTEFEECELFPWNQLSDKEKSYFDYVDDEDKDDFLFFIFKGSWQTLDDYIIPNEPNEDYEGIHSMAYDSAHVVKDIEGNWAKFAYVYWSSE